MGAGEGSGKGHRREGTMLNLFILFLGGGRGGGGWIGERTPRSWALPRILRLASNLPD